MDAVLGQLYAGISLGSVLLLIALGLVLTFGQMGVINMAHGEFLMAGAYTAFVVQQVFDSAGLSLLIALPLSFLVGGLLGVLLEVTLISRLYSRPLDTLLVTWGVSLVLQQLARDLFGAPAVEVRAPRWLQGNVEVFGTPFTTGRLFIVALAVTSVAVLSAVLRFTALGRRIRAVVQSRGLAETSGIDSRRTDRISFFIGSGLAGMAGVALTLIASTQPYMGQTYIVDAFLVVVAGGVGQVRGAVLAAFGLGVLQAVFAYSQSVSTAKVLLLLVVIAFLQLRPQGLFSVRTRSLV
ncbi:urea ABC transporter permease subunit UrtB [Blastococcus sp. CT_GayMR19]|uniref:urea ABC transporter permease subunit UrtB n=1 Tax=Blastococcus sp. CT_GayMR19 TaxID=2559608 RepID=UPI001073F5C1|nr:urea ABC transporter permease subunit UrtB [Blastococcus sp. CT_GayMR19]TFV79251.1 urea ABC transporter permease subunit UrtB [Blastococcus sp. CT_GayMR19]